MTEYPKSKFYGYEIAQVYYDARQPSVHAGGSAVLSDRLLGAHVADLDIVFRRHEQLGIDFTHFRGDEPEVEL